jgi:hypothetical protein
MKGQEGDMSGNEKGELDGQKTVLTITYQSNLTLRVTTPTVPDPILRYASGGSAVALGAYRETGMVTRVVQRTI